jgi:tetratricopeptide (TPR) repeat protein/tRNA A-37 threonylcarbamoyl transferase component Bud32
MIELLSAMTEQPTQDTVIETPHEAVPPLARGTVVGRFVVLDALGQGGMGVVYRAYDPELDRQIALKLVRPRRGDPARTRARVQREAQALAQLSHPNVVSIYDIGLFEEQVFIAMELVDGEDLRVWLGSAPRTHAEILAVCTRAGEGLAAAHRAGLVHRDFKPENVVIGKDGRVHVLDFGLARSLHDRDSDGDSGDHAALDPVASGHASSGRLGEHLTADGTVLGTPPYMAPEQFYGKRIDARSDQFSFCVTLYEALYGEHPFGPSARGALVDWQVCKPPDDSTVPAWLRVRLLRGLARDPEERFASMDELVATLRDDPDEARHRRTRSLRRAVVLSMLGAVLGIAAFVAVRRAGPAPCAGADARIHELWSPKARASIHAAFTRSGVPYAERAFRGLEARLDRYAADWAGMRVESCRATHERHEQSAALLERRTLCLDELALDLGGMIEVLGHADAAVVQRALGAAYQLRPVRDCVSPRAGRPVAKSEAALAQAEVRTQLSRARALDRTGQFERGLIVASAALERATVIGDDALHAEARFWTAKLQEGTAAYEQAELNYFEAVEQAERLGDDELRARALSRLVYVVGYRRARHAEGYRLADLAGAVLDRLGTHTLDRAELESNLGTLLYAESRYDEAAVHDQKALALREAALGDESPEVALSLNNLGLLYCDTGRCAEGLVPLTRALALRERVLGPDHPDVGVALSNLGLAHYMLGQYAAAGDFYARALQLRERVLDAAHPSLAFTLEGLGAVRVAQGRLDEAIALLRRSVQVREVALGAEHPDVASSLLGLAQALIAQNQLDEALALERRALAIFAKVFGTDNVDHALADAAIAEILRRQGHLDEAIARLGASATILARELGEDDPELARIALSWGQALAARGQHDAATVRLEQVLTQCGPDAGCPPELVPQAKLSLANLALRSGDRARALELAQGARAAFRTLPSAVADIAAGSKATDVLIARLTGG